jgi:alpha-1,6-mannosyltransferase
MHGRPAKTAGQPEPTLHALFPAAYFRLLDAFGLGRELDAAAFGWRLLGVLCVCGALFVATLIVARRRRFSGTDLALATAIALLFVLAAPSALDNDVQSYLFYGRIAAIHRQNPMVLSPRAFAGDPYYGGLVWRDVPSVYGPVWLFVCTAIAFVARSGALYLVLFRALAAACHAAVGWLLWRLVPVERPNERWQATALWLLNPLCLIDLVAGAHNEGFALALLMLGLAVGLHGTRRQSVLAAMAVLALAVNTKVSALPAVAVIGAFFVRRTPLSRAAQAVLAAELAGIALAVTALVHAPFWTAIHHPLQTGYALVPGGRTLVNSPLGASMDVVYDLALRLRLFGDREPWGYGLLIDAAHVIAGAVAFAAVVLAVRASTSADRLYVWLAGVYLVEIAFCATYFFPWYTALILPFVALARSRSMSRIAVALSLCTPIVAVVFPSFALLARDAVSLALLHHRVLFAFGPAYLLGAIAVIACARRSALQRDTTLRREVALGAALIGAALVLGMAFTRPQPASPSVSRAPGDVTQIVLGASCRFVVRAIRDPSDYMFALFGRRSLHDMGIALAYDPPVASDGVHLVVPSTVPAALVFLDGDGRVLGSSEVRPGLELADVTLPGGTRRVVATDAADLAACAPELGGRHIE